MSSWSEGYVSDINYTFGYYSELNPNNAIIPFLMAVIALLNKLPQLGCLGII
ncbi:hypothetical protein [Rodentibacter ratti]|uniref:hypothetical protein n=1 Tax=Rodentibacter ratti TaxID=1906745 RepID=UPI0015D663EE|nr:hypothetical protein [Rodentibacter ratti]